MNKKQLFGTVFSAFVLSACSSHYQLAGIQRTRIVVDNRYDARPDAAAAAFLAPYKQQVDSVMGPVVGFVAHDMTANRPESDLSNLLSDILVWASAEYGEKPVLGIYNMGGIRMSIVAIVDDDACPLYANEMVV